MTKSLKEIQIDEKIDKITDHLDTIADHLRGVNHIINEELDVNDGYTQEQLSHVSDYIREIDDGLTIDGTNDTMDILHNPTHNTNNYPVPFIDFDISYSEYSHLSQDAKDALHEYDELAKQKLFDDIDQRLNRELTKL